MNTSGVSGAGLRIVMAAGRTAAAAAAGRRCFLRFLLKRHSRVAGNAKQTFLDFQVLNGKLLLASVFLQVGVLSRRRHSKALGFAVQHKGRRDFTQFVPLLRISDVQHGVPHIRRQRCLPGCRVLVGVQEGR